MKRAATPALRPGAARDAAAAPASLAARAATLPVPGAAAAAIASALTGSARPGSPSETPAANPAACAGRVAGRGAATGDPPPRQQRDRQAWPHDAVDARGGQLGCRARDRHAAKASQRRPPGPLVPCRGETGSDGEPRRATIGQLACQRRHAIKDGDGGAERAKRPRAQPSAGGHLRGAFRSGLPNIHQFDFSLHARHLSHRRPVSPQWFENAEASCVAVSAGCGRPRRPRCRLGVSGAWWRRRRYRGLSAMAGPTSRRGAGS